MIGVLQMEAANLFPVSTDSGIGGSTLGAFAGALFGSWFGDGVGVRGGVNAVPAVSAVTQAVDTGIVLDQLSTMQQSINGVGLSVVNGVNGVNTSVLTSANATQQGIANLGYMDSQNTFQVVNALTQGFAGLNTAIASQGYESRLSTQQLGTQMAECCCEIKGAILADGAATRQLIQNNLIAELQTKLCDAKSTISTLESNAFVTASNAQQTNIILSHLTKK